MSACKYWLLKLRDLCSHIQIGIHLRGSYGVSEGGEAGEVSGTRALQLAVPL